MLIALLTAVFLLGGILLILLIRILVMKNELRHMTEELRRNRDKLYNRSLTVTLIDRDLTELANAINEELDFQRHLRTSNEQAEQMLKQSVSDIAHDLRTPLTVIKGNLQLMKLESQSDRSREYLRICSDRTDRLKQMADDFFELSVLESEQTAVMSETVDAVRLLMEFIAENEAVIREKGLTPEILLPQGPIRLIGDPQFISRVLENLLNNVLKYARERFTLALEEKDGFCRITFANHAPTLTQTDAERIFDRTYRAGKARQGNGNGLGLYIVKLLMEKQHGTVSAVLKDGTLAIHADFPLYRSKAV